MDSKKKGDLLIRDLWEKGVDCVLNMRVVNTVAKSYQMRTPEKCLVIVEQDKKCNFLDSCIQQRRHLYPSVVSVDGLLGVEA